MTEIKKIQIDKKSFGYGFDLQDTYFIVLAYHKVGLVEDEIYQKMESEFREVYEAPSRETVEDYVHQAAEIVKQAEEKITKKGNQQSDAQEKEEPLSSGSSFWNLIFLE